MTSMIFAAVSMFAAVFPARSADAVPVTAGWENSAPDRRECEVAEEKLVWKADMKSERAFRLVKLDGAEGEMDFVNGEIRVRKFNDVGTLVVEAKAFHLPSNVTAMFSIEVTVPSAVPGRSHGCIMASPGSGIFGVQREVRGLDGGNGRHIMFGLNEQPAGTYYRKYRHYAGKNADVLPMIVVSGDPSVSVWRKWRAENVKDSREEYKKLRKESDVRRRSAGYPIASAEEVARQCAESIDHTAKIVTENGVTYLTVDGKKTSPSAFHSVYHHSDFSEMTSGQPITSRGVPITIAWVYGANPMYVNNSAWPTGFEYDVEKAAENFRNMMRGDTNALYMICYDCNAPKDFVAKCCPGEGWLDEDGRQVIGGTGYFLGRGVKSYDPKRYWPWVSMASPTWRGAVKRNLRALVAELKRTGHTKKVIGIHFLGYNDGQFGMNRPDYSPCAQKEYARYVKENPGVSTNYWQFCRQLGTLAQADFARAFKEEMGKDVVAMRWDDAPFVVDYSHGVMNRDPGGIDITVSQTTYADRWPAIADTPYVPWSSMQLHNKMHWYELDLRTWWAMTGSTLPVTTGNGYSPDIVHWRSVYRKLAGTMLATRSGFWFYDMGRGWFAAPEIAEDIGESIKVARYLIEKKPSPWRSDVAVVIDEEGQFGVEGGRGFRWSGTLYNVSQRQLSYMAGAGVPYDCYLAEDVIADPSLVKDKKTVVFIFWRHFDDRRLAAVKALSGLGQTHVFLCETGCLGGAKEATGFDIEYSPDNVRSYRLKREPHFRESVVGSYETEMNRGWLPELGAKRPFIEPTGRQVWIKEEPGVIVHARYLWDTDRVAVAERRDKEARRWYLAVPGGLSPELFNRLARESGAYVPVDKTGLVVYMNGDFISIHALSGGRYDFKLPFDCTVRNVASGKAEKTRGRTLPLNVTAGETCWFLLEKNELNRAFRIPFSR